MGRVSSLTLPCGASAAPRYTNIPRLTTHGLPPDQTHAVRLDTSPYSGNVTLAQIVPGWKTSLFLLAAAATARAEEPSPEATRVTCSCRIRCWALWLCK